MEFGPDWNRPPINLIEGKPPSILLASLYLIIPKANDLYLRKSHGDDSHLAIFNGECRVYRDHNTALSRITRKGGSEFGVLGVRDPEMQSLSCFPAERQSRNPKRALILQGVREGWRKSGDGKWTPQDKEFRTKTPCQFQVSNRQITITSNVDVAACRFDKMEGFVWNRTGDFSVLLSGSWTPAFSCQLVDFFVMPEVALSVYLAICLHSGNMQHFYDEVCAAYLEEVRRYHL